ncbi:MAG: hypothetical protein MUC62_02270 [Candidatus Thermoplasmatota archaeon]|nr:hypothetical protein [Candidatus Thermoplasmatota archaeon]
MDTLTGNLSRVQGVKGLGETRLGALLSNLGHTGLETALGKGDIAGLVQAGSIPEKLAIDMVLAYRAEDLRRLRTSENAEDIFMDIRSMLTDRMRTDHARNQVSLMVPSCDPVKNVDLSSERYLYRSLLEGKDRDRVNRLFSRVGARPKAKRALNGPDHMLLAESEKVRAALAERGLDKTMKVITPEELDDIRPEEVVLIFENRELDEEKLPLIAAVPITAQDHEIAPECVLERLLPSRDRLVAVSELEDTFCRPGRAGEAVLLLDELSSLSSQPPDEARVLGTLEVIREELRSSMKDRIEALSFTGEDAIALLLREEPPALKDIYRDHARMASELVRERLGVRKDLFIMTFPPDLDMEAVSSMLEEGRSVAASSRFSSRVRAAASLVGMGLELEKELHWAEELDLRWGIGSFVYDHDLSPFSASDDLFEIKDAATLELRRTGNYQPVSYNLGGVGGQRTALLTGANSGGKTTLLETLAQTVILAAMGMPVPASQALVPPLERLVIYRPKRRLDAGGLEGFLKELLPLSLDVDGRTLVLADELEAMTELDAASRIIGVFLDELVSRKAYGVVVSHLADEICRFTSCRVDGIEATGLDDRNELIVDRTPHIGQKANSTPELILKKLESISVGRERELYSRVLTRFG